MSKSIFEKVKESDFLDLINKCKRFIEIDESIAIKDSNELIASRKNKSISLSESNNIIRVQNNWYNSLEYGTPDYSVYEDPYYLCDVWGCWALYSRQSVRVLSSKNSMEAGSVLDHMGKIGTIADIGCGFGYTTAGLKELFPLAKVSGTNLEGSYQYLLAKELGAEKGFKIYPNLLKIGEVDLIFASEYFEHFVNPLEHLCEVVEISNPKFMITANGFNSKSIGHFNNYTHDGKWFDNRTMSKMFNKKMRELGYEKLKTKIWNSRPAVWERKMVHKNNPVSKSKIRFNCSYDKEVELSKLVEHPKNPNAHPSTQIARLAKIIEYQGMRSPIVVSKLSGCITKGHGRLKALKLLGWKTAPVNYQDYEDDAQEYADIVADNAIANWAVLSVEEIDIQLIELGDTINTDMLGMPSLEVYGPTEGEEENTSNDIPKEEQENYSRKIKAPIYEPKGECPHFEEMLNTDKRQELLNSIDKSGVTGELKEFLTAAAFRHSVFNYEKIAEYYSHASKEVQELMEESALVIIDFKKAIEGGFVRLTKGILESYGDE